MIPPPALLRYSVEAVNQTNPELGLLIPGGGDAFVVVDVVVVVVDDVVLVAGGAMVLVVATAAESPFDDSDDPEVIRPRRNANATATSAATPRAP